MDRSTKFRLFGGLVLLFNLWLIGRYSLEGLPVLLLTLGFAIGYEFLVVRSVRKSDLDEVYTPPLANTPANSPLAMQDHQPLQAPTISPDVEMEHLAVTREGERYRYKTYLYDKLDDALKYARLDRSRTYKCK